MESRRERLARVFALGALRETESCFGHRLGVNLPPSLEKRQESLLVIRSLVAHRSHPSSVSDAGCSRCRSP
jgi:hypothetical protein